MKHIFISVYSLLISASLVLVSSPALAQSDRPTSKRDTINREITVVSDKVLEIDESQPIFLPITLSQQQVERYNPATPKSTGDFTPAINPPQKPVLTGYAAQLPQPYTGVMARIYAGYMPTLGGDLALRWASKEYGSILSFDVSHLSEQSVFLKRRLLSMPPSEPIVSESPEGRYYENGLKNQRIYRHATQGAVSYAYHWRESLIELRGAIRSNIFANRLNQLDLKEPRIKSPYDLDGKVWKSSLQEYWVGATAQQLEIENWVFDLGVGYSYTTNRLPSSDATRLQTEEGLHRLEANASTTLSLSDDWALGLSADFLTHSPMYQPSLPIPIKDSFPVSLLRLKPQFRYRGFVGVADLDLSAGVGADLNLGDLKECVFYPEIRLSLSNQRSWQWYLRASGGLHDVNFFDFLSQHPGLSSISIPQLERQQLHSKMGVKFMAGGAAIDLYGGYDFYYRANGYSLTPYGSFLMEHKNYYGRLQTWFGGIEAQGVIGKLVEMGGGLQYNHHITKERWSYQSKPALESFLRMRVLASRRFNIGGHISCQLGHSSGITHPKENNTDPQLNRPWPEISFSQLFMQASVIAQYQFTDNWTVFGSLDSRVDNFGPMVSQQPFSVRLGVQANWSAK